MLVNGTQQKKPLRAMLREVYLETMMTIITKVNVLLLKLSKGRLGNSFLGTPVLLLEMVGYKSGKKRSTPLFYLQEDG